MNTTTRKACSLTAAITIFGSLVGGANAAVTVTFSEVGGDVIGTLSGSLTVPISPNFDDQPIGAGQDGSIGDPFRLATFFVGTPSVDRYEDGSFIASGLNANPSSFSGTVSFGYTGAFLFVHHATVPGSVITPTGSWTWSGETLDSIGLGSLTTQTVYTASNAETIQFVNASAVPEPSSIALLGLGCLSLAFRRSRR